MSLPIPHDVRLIALVAFFSVSGWAQTSEIDALRARSGAGTHDGHDRPWYEL